MVCLLTKQGSVLHALGTLADTEKNCTPEGLIKID